MRIKKLLKRMHPNQEVQIKDKAGNTWSDEARLVKLRAPNDSKVELIEVIGNVICVTIK